KTAVVTGAGSGIGQAIASTFAAHGARVFILERDAAGAATTVERIDAAGGVAVAVACDVADAASVSAAFARLDAEAERLDILVNNAGMAHMGRGERTRNAASDRLYAVNVKGVFLCAQAAIRRMTRQGGGVILNLASIASLIGLEDRFAYSMSKGAVLA